MAWFDSFVEWFNGLIGLQYAGYGPITAIFIGILTVAVSMRVVKFFFKPFAPLFQTSEELGEANPVLEQKGIRQSQLHTSGFDTHYDSHDNANSVIGRSVEKSLSRPSPGRVGRSQAPNRSRFQELCEMDVDDVQISDPVHSSVAPVINSLLAEAEDIEPIDDFDRALDEALEEDNRSRRVAPVRPARNGRPNLTVVPTPPRPAAKTAATASAKPAPTSVGQKAMMPLIQVINFCDRTPGLNGTVAGVDRLALRLGEGVCETLARIPNIAVEKTAEAKTGLVDIPGFGPRFLVEGGVSVKPDGICAAVSVRSGADGAELLNKELICKPSELQTFEREAALEIAAAVIAHQQSANRTATPSSAPRPGEQSGSTYPSARRPSPEHLRRTDQPVR